MDTEQGALNLDQEIQIVRGRLAQVTMELREAKQLAAEKLLEFEIARDQYQIDNNPVNANTMDHSQQRLALAEMGVESRAAKFERIQKRLEELALVRQQLLDQPLDAPLKKIAIEKSPLKSGSATRTMPLKSSTENNNRISTARMTAEIAQTLQPIISAHGKVTNLPELTEQLQKLERHLMAAAANADSAIKVKAFGTAIPGELNLSPLGGNQYFARFIAPAGQVSLIVGARLQEYHRSKLELEFLPEEQGKEFVLIFDMNQPADTRALVFPETMMLRQEMFAAHNDY